MLDKLTRREYFAGLAMQGLVTIHFHCSSRATDEEVARNAVELADELIYQLKEMEPPLATKDAS